MAACKATQDQASTRPPQRWCRRWCRSRLLPLRIKRSPSAPVAAPAALDGSGHFATRAAQRGCCLVSASVARPCPRSLGASRHPSRSLPQARRGTRVTGDRGAATATMAATATTAARAARRRSWRARRRGAPPGVRPSSHAAARLTRPSRRRGAPPASPARPRAPAGRAWARVSSSMCSRTSVVTLISPVAPAPSRREARRRAAALVHC